MAVFTFTSPSAEVIDGTGDADTFVSSNLNLNAGDRANGRAGFDDFQYFADATLTGSGLLGAGARNFSTFILNDIERFTVSNDAARQINFDMSSTVNNVGFGIVNTLTEVSNNNSSAAVAFDQMTKLVDIRLTQLTNSGTADTIVGFQTAVLAGANDRVTLTLDNTNGGLVRLGTSTATLGAPTNTGVETVALQAINAAPSVIDRLDTDLTTLIVNDDPTSAAAITITQALNTSVRTINSLTDGNLTTSWANNLAAGGVVYTGASFGTGVNRLVAGAGNDSITTFAGNDVIDAGAGNDTINAGNGNNIVRTGAGTNIVITGIGADSVYVQGIDNISTGLGNDVVDVTGATGFYTVSTGDGVDVVIANGVFDGSAGRDTINFGGATDFLITSAGLADVNFRQVTQADGLAINTAGTTVLQGSNSFGTSFAQQAGFTAVYLISGSTANDVVDASTYGVGLLIASHSSNAAAQTTDVDGGFISTGNRFNNFLAGGGDDTVTTGSGADLYLFRGTNNLTDADRLNAQGSSGAQSDALVLNGNTTLTGTASFVNFEFLALESAVTAIYNPGAPNLAGNQYNLTFTNANAPSAGQRLTVAGNNLQAAGAAVVGATVAANLTGSENAVINAGLVTAFTLNVTTGAGADVVTTSNQLLGVQGDFVQTQGGNDIITDGGAGNDAIESGDGNDVVFLTAGNNVVADTSGNNQVTLGSGNDTVVFYGALGNDLIIAGTQLTGADTLVDLGGIDTVRISGRAYNDVDFAGVNTGQLQGFEILEVSGINTFNLGANAQRAGFRTIIATDIVASTINLAPFTQAVRVDLSAGGDDVVTLGSPTALATFPANFPVMLPAQPPRVPAAALNFIGEAPGSTAYNNADVSANANLVIAGIGNQTVNGGSGTDVLRVDGTELTVADRFAGGAGVDVVQLDNSLGQVNADVSLMNFTSVDLYQFTSNGVLSPFNDNASHTIQFGAAPVTAVNTFTPIIVDLSALTDVNDQTTVTLAASLLDADFGFFVQGNATRTTVVKSNFGVNNNINFQGGSGVDTLAVNGADLGATTVFNGAGGIDVIAQTGGVVTDDSYASVSNVEVLAGGAGAAINATLGSQALASGLVTIMGTTNIDTVLLDAAFTGPLAISFGGGAGADVFDAGASAAVITFSATGNELTAGDLFTGGTTAGDVLNYNLTAAGANAADITSMVGVETVNINSNLSAGTNTTVTLATQAGQVNGGTLTINSTSPTFGGDNLTINGAAASARIVFNGGDENDTVNTGTGNDLINLGNGTNSANAGVGNNTVNGGTGVDTVRTQGGTDLVNGGDGNDVIRTGAGIDTVNGDGGDDLIWTEDGNDIVNGGAGNDSILGGLGADTLTGGAGNDIFYYGQRAASTAGSTDTITDFTSGSDVINIRGMAALDLTGTLAGSTIAFKGNFDSFGGAQGATVAGDSFLDVVFQRDLPGGSTGTLWFDLNNDGTLNGNDLQIRVTLTSGSDFIAADVLSGATLDPLVITTFQGLFPA